MPIPIWLQSLLPQKVISRVAGCFSDTTIVWLKNTIIERFSSAYGVDLQEAEIQNPKDFPSFNAFFTRRLKASARPLPTQLKAIASPADGLVSELGTIENDRLYQAKNHHYTLTELLTDATLAKEFEYGHFMTVYLSPKNYHRVHMPINGKLREMIYVPGRLFSVNPFTVSRLPRVFARNERVVSIFDTDSGPMAVILVGAFIVGSIETVWAGCVTPPRGQSIVRTDYAHATPTMDLNRGDEMGHFKLGSTAIVLLPKNVGTWREDLKAGMSLKMGESVGHLI